MNKIYIFGGFNGKNCNNDLYILEIQTLNIIKIASIKKELRKRQRHTAAIINNEDILVFVGYYGLQWYNSVDIINIKTLFIENLVEEKASNYTENMSKIFNNKKFSDICFVVDGVNLYGHKSIICSRSEYFGNMFSNNMMESQMENILIKTTDYNSFKMFLEFVYTSSISTLKDPNSVIKLYGNI